MKKAENTLEFFMSQVDPYSLSPIGKSCCQYTKHDMVFDIVTNLLMVLDISLGGRLGLSLPTSF